MAGKFTSSTEGPKPGEDANMFAGHEWVYEDMRGNHFAVTWKGSSPDRGGLWIAAPFPDAVAAYKDWLPYIALGRQFNAAETAKLLVDGIEDLVDTGRLRAMEEDRQQSWIWLLVIAGGIYYYDKKHRRR